MEKQTRDTFLVLCAALVAGTFAFKFIQEQMDRRALIKGVTEFSEEIEKNLSIEKSLLKQLNEVRTKNRFLRTENRKLKKENERILKKYSFQLDREGSKLEFSWDKENQRKELEKRNSEKNKLEKSQANKRKAERLININ